MVQQLQVPEFSCHEPSQDRIPYHYPKKPSRERLKLWSIEDNISGRWCHQIPPFYFSEKYVKAVGCAFNTTSADITMQLTTGTHTQVF